MTTFDPTLYCLCFYPLSVLFFSEIFRQRFLTKYRKVAAAAIQSHFVNVIAGSNANFLMIHNSDIQQTKNEMKMEAFHHQEACFQFQLNSCSKTIDSCTAQTAPTANIFPLNFRFIF